MRALVVIDSHDMQQALGLVQRDGNLVPELFTIDNCNFDLAVFPASLASRIAVPGRGDMTIADVAHDYDAIVVAAGHYAINNDSLVRFVRDYLLGGNSGGYSNEAAIILTLGRLADHPFPTLPGDRTFVLPWKFPDDTADWVGHVHRDLHGVARMIDENQTRNPNVGFGLLLVNDSGSFFLMERLREPGQHKLGTIGGDFERGNTIDEQLQDIVAKRFRSSRELRIELGPLLSCTNMKNSYMHYVDLTFLAIARGSISNVYYDDLRPVQPSAIAEAELPARRRPNPYLFTLPEVARFHEHDMLFTPVANAFESLTRTILADQLRYGRKNSASFPSLLDESALINLRLPADPDSVRKVVSDMPWSASTIPFFEGDV